MIYSMLWKVVMTLMAYGLWIIGSFFFEMHTAAKVDKHWNAWGKAKECRSVLTGRFGGLMDIDGVKHGVDVYDCNGHIIWFHAGPVNNYPEAQQAWFWKHPGSWMGGGKYVLYYADSDTDPTPEKMKKMTRWIPPNA